MRCARGAKNRENAFVIDTLRNVSDPADDRGEESV